ncbi:hypothetical protein [Anaeromassilibacillus senegalensis]|uniref:Uncharacterized protein n=1 Tax=Anaeromassilibacillus senegalensis TaxID=1673717 RepID=A0ABS9CMB3_9FIRM|nr:hypothetical protein [Anaeromassilibacillus senegalensis]MCF2652113.1 hypothetical protein [Anaeromassilibacillus senegalensis]
MICKPEAYQWMNNDEWFDYDENDFPYLTDKAPEEARKSFEIWLGIQRMKAEHPDRVY